MGIRGLGSTVLSFVCYNFLRVCNRLMCRRTDKSVCTQQLVKGLNLSEEEQAYIEDNLPAQFADILVSDLLPLQQTKTFRAKTEVEGLQLQIADFREVSVRACASEPYVPVFVLFVAKACKTTARHRVGTRMGPNIWFGLSQAVDRTNNKEGESFLRFELVRIFLKMLEALSDRDRKILVSKTKAKRARRDKAERSQKLKRASLNRSHTPAGICDRLATLVLLFCMYVAEFRVSRMKRLQQTIMDAAHQATALKRRFSHARFAAFS